jgi:hypothetical protein
MHTVSTEERNGQYRFTCTCGTTGNWYGTAEVAQSTGYSHKEYAEGSPNTQPGGSDDPHVGY